MIQRGAYTTMHTDMHRTVSVHFLIRCNNESYTYRQMHSSYACTAIAIQILAIATYRYIFS